MNINNLTMYVSGQRPCLDGQSVIEDSFMPLWTHHNMTLYGNQGKRH